MYNAYTRVIIFNKSASVTTKCGMVTKRVTENVSLAPAVMDDVTEQIFFFFFSQFQTNIQAIKQPSKQINDDPNKKVLTYKKVCACKQCISV